MNSTGNHAAGGAVPLVSDLDDTLLQTDTLWEGLLRLLRRKPWALFSLVAWLRRGRLRLKQRLIPYSLAGAPLYPVNGPVRDRLRRAAEEGRAICLATASPKAVADAVRAETGLPFSRIFASDDALNLKGEAKARLLGETFGEKGFDYIGDSLTDVPVWRAARRAIVASADPRVIAAARAVNPDCETLPIARPAWRDYARALRVHQWGKNLLVFAPLILAHRFDQIGTVFWAFFSLCFCASAIYVVNDLCDLDNDRKHPVKKKRPFASGLVPLRSAPWLFGVCVLSALLPCLFLPTGFLLCLLGYFCLTNSYSLFIKRRLFLDVIVLSGLYVLRVVAGAVIISSDISNWLLGFAGFFFLGLALLKRAGAVEVQGDGGKLHGRAYLADDRPILEGMAICSGFAAFVVVALYIDSLQAAELYTRPGCLWGVCPLLVYWYGRIVILAHRGKLCDDPVHFAVRDRGSYGIAALLALVFWLAL